MVYKPERKQQTFERGDSGIGKIRFSTDGKKVQVVLNVPNGKDQFTEKKYVIDTSDCPDNILLAKNAKEWMIQMSGQGDKIMSFRPVRGVFVVTTKAFASKEGSEPTPKNKEVDFYKDGKHIHYNYDQFTVLLEILEPEVYKSLVIPLILHYNFDEIVKNGKSYVQYSMGGKYTEALDEYCEAAGIQEDKYWPMEYKDNILPNLQRIALHEGRKFQVTVKDGWIVPGSLITFDEPVNELPFDNADADESVFEDTTDFDADDAPYQVGDEIDFEPDEL